MGALKMLLGETKNVEIYVVMLVFYGKVYGNIITETMFYSYIF